MEIGQEAWIAIQPGMGFGEKFLIMKGDIVKIEMITSGIEYTVRGERTVIVLLEDLYKTKEEALEKARKEIKKRYDHYLHELRLQEETLRDL